MRILITAGPTREYLDPVRYISNASSGRQGCALAAAARARGCHVTLVLGPAGVEPPEVDELAAVVTAADMFEAVHARFDGCDVFIAAAAVSDYRPVHREQHKIKKSDSRVTVELERTADIVGQMSKRRRRGQMIVGFCLESEDLQRRAQGKLEAKRLDYVVANSPAAIGAERQDALILSPRGVVRRLADVTKDDLAAAVLDVILAPR
jgi:phosphopantothenoylcysteine decarboxylase/phosphopantothenate--cysteine ligase